MDPNAILSGLKTAIQAATPVAATPQDQSQSQTQQVEQITKLFTLQGYQRALSCAGRCPVLQDRVTALQADLQGAPQVVNASARDLSSGAYTAPTIARLIEARSFVDGMTLAGRLTSPDVIGAMDLIRGLEIQLAQEQG